MDDVRRRFLFSARQRVLDSLLSGWRRRGSSLLHIGLNGGLSPECFWEAGFDVTALDRSQEKLVFWREQTGPKVGYACSSLERLPFGDGEFDYAVLVHHGLKRRKAAGIGAGLSDGIPSELAEALRVAARGIIILEWNRFSLGGVPVLEQQAGEDAAHQRKGECVQHAVGVDTVAEQFINGAKGSAEDGGQQISKGDAHPGTLRRFSR